MVKEEGEAAFASLAGLPFEVTSVQKKKGTESPPQLNDLTSLQVDCNKKFGCSAEMMLNLIRSLSHIHIYRLTAPVGPALPRS